MHGVELSDPGEEGIQVQLLRQLLSDHLLSHALGFIGFLVGEHVSLRLEDLAIDGPVREGCLTHHSFTFFEVHFDQSLFLLVIFNLELYVNITHFRIIVALLQIVH